MSSQETKLIVGLGNFGREYEGTYHNVGFLTIDRMLQRIGGDCVKKECQALTCHALVDGAKVIIAKPQTYMNLSGEAVQELSHRYKVPQENIIVVCDDVDLPVGASRLRAKGSAGTHNGLRNIVLLNGENFNRLRLGIGRPPECMDLASYVLSHIDNENLTMIISAVNRAVDALINFSAGDSIERLAASVNVK